MKYNNDLEWKQIFSNLRARSQKAQHLTFWDIRNTTTELILPKLKLQKAMSFPWIYQLTRFQDITQDLIGFLSLHIVQLGQKMPKQTKNQMKQKEWKPKNPKISQIPFLHSLNNNIQSTNKFLSSITPISRK